MALPSGNVKNITTTDGVTHEIIPERLKNGSYEAVLPTLTADSTIALTSNIPTKDSDITTNDRYVRFDTSTQGLNTTQKSNARTNIGAGIGSVTSVRVQATSPVKSSQNAQQLTTLDTTISLDTAYGDIQNPYGSKTANYVLAAPNGSAGVPSFRELVKADLPTLNTSDLNNDSGFLSSAVTSLGGKTGAITLGTGLSIDANNELSATAVVVDLGTITLPYTMSDADINTIDNNNNALLKFTLGLDTYYLKKSRVYSNYVFFDYYGKYVTNTGAGLNNFYLNKTTKVLTQKQNPFFITGTGILYDSTYETLSVDTSVIAQQTDLANYIPLAGSSAITGSLVPSTNNSIDFGDSDHNWKNLYGANIYLYDRTDAYSDNPSTAGSRYISFRDKAGVDISNLYTTIGNGWNAINFKLKNKSNDTRNIEFCHDSTNSQWRFCCTTTDSVDLGTSSRRWKNIYAGNNIIIGDGNSSKTTTTILTPSNTPAAGSVQNIMQVSFKNAAGNVVYTAYPIAIIGTDGTDGYNTGVVLGSKNGPTFLSSGESASVLPGKLGSSAYNSENVYITSDSQVKFITNAANDGSSYNSAIYMNSGSFYATNVYASSDERLKENIKSAEIDCSNIIKDLQIREFNFKDDEEKKVVVGAIAQELKAILPEKYQAELVSGSEEEYYSINEGKLLYIAIGALKDEMQKTKELEERLEKVEKLLEK